MCVFFLPALWNVIVRKKQADQKLARPIGWSLLMMTIILPSLSTTIMETFVCEEFADGRFLSAQLTLSLLMSLSRQNPGIA